MFLFRFILLLSKLQMLRRHCYLHEYHAQLVHPDRLVIYGPCPDLGLAEPELLLGLESKRVRIGLG